MRQTNMFYRMKFMEKTDKNAKDDDSNVKTYHIKLKRNFIGIIEPTTLKRLTMSITGDDARTGDEY